MKLTINCCILLLLQIYSFGQTIPKLSGETVTNQNINLPEDLKGKYSLICFASSSKAQDDLESWLDPVYQRYIAKTGLMDDMYDVNVYFIPVLTGTNVTFAATMKKKFNEAAQADLKPHVLFCKVDGKEILTTLNIHKSDAPHFYLLDKNTKIIYQTSGHFTEEKFDAIDDLIE